jgi:hypothetical protein
VELLPLALLLARIGVEPRPVVPFLRLQVESPRALVGVEDVEGVAFFLVGIGRDVGGGFQEPLNRVVETRMGVKPCERLTMPAPSLSFSTHQTELSSWSAVWGNPHPE